MEATSNISNAKMFETISGHPYVELPKFNPTEYSAPAASVVKENKTTDLAQIDLNKFGEKLQELGMYNEIKRMQSPIV